MTAIIRNSQCLDHFFFFFFVMNLLAPVSSIMTKGVTTVKPDDSLKHVEDMFSHMKVHHLPVVEENNLVGMVSRSDYLFFKRGFNDFTSDDRLDLFRLKSYRVKDIMTTGIAKLEPNDKLNVALEVFKANLFHAIPIVDNGKLVGILTTFDIINNLANDKEAINKYEIK